MSEPLSPVQLHLTRQRVLRFGSEQLTDIEILAVLLGPGFSGRNAFEVARKLLDQSGNLHNLLQKIGNERPGLNGLGLVRLARLKAALELGRRYLEGPRDQRRAMTEPLAAANCFKARLVDLSYEVFGCLFLDTRHRLICFEILFRGTVDGAQVYPREVLKRALHHNAAAVILGHYVPRHIMRLMFPVWLCGAFCSHTVDTMASA